MPGLSVGLTTSSNGFPSLPGSSKVAATSTDAGADSHKMKAKEAIPKDNLTPFRAALSLLEALDFNSSIRSENFPRFNLFHPRSQPKKLGFFITIFY